VTSGMWLGSRHHPLFFHRSPPPSPTALGTEAASKAAQFLERVGKARLPMA